MRSYACIESLRLRLSHDTNKLSTIGKYSLWDWDKTITVVELRPIAISNYSVRWEILINIQIFFADEVLCTVQSIGSNAKMPNKH